MLHDEVSLAASDGNILGVIYFASAFSAASTDFIAVPHEIA